jgi:hypothetical protein
MGIFIFKNGKSHKFGVLLEVNRNMAVDIPHPHW